MNYKEKAVQLVESFNKITDRAGAIMCVNLMADEVIKILPSVYLTDDNHIHSGHRQYWEGIKNELLKL